MPDTPASEPLSDGERAVLGQRVSCEDKLGLTWVRVEALPEPSALQRQNRRNESVLRSLTMLEEHDESQAEDAERAELHRLEGKLNLALELLAELVRERSQSSPSVFMRFSAEGLCWHSAEALEPGTLLLTEWFVLPAWPVALKLHARIESRQPQQQGYLLCARLEGQSDSAKDWLEKLVFRRHRRAIAQQRVTRSGESDPPEE